MAPRCLLATEAMSRYFDLSVPRVPWTLIASVIKMSPSTYIVYRNSSRCTYESLLEHTVCTNPHETTNQDVGTIGHEPYTVARECAS